MSTWTGAEFILTIGREIGEEANVVAVPRVADAIGATLGCSRPSRCRVAAKSGRSGQSGKNASAVNSISPWASPRAIQHLAGMKHVSTIVAVNSRCGGIDFRSCEVRHRRRHLRSAAELRRQFEGDAA